MKIKVKKIKVKKDFFKNNSQKAQAIKEKTDTFALK